MSKVEDELKRAGRGLEKGVKTGVKSFGTGMEQNFKGGLRAVDETLRKYAPYEKAGGLIQDMAGLPSAGEARKGEAAAAEAKTAMQEKRRKTMLEAAELEDEMARRKSAAKSKQMGRSLLVATSPTGATRQSMG